MKRVIDGKVYDTDKAELIHSWTNGGPGDHEYTDEGLYVTEKGAYFIAGSGGPKTSYVEQTGPNEWSGGSRIVVLDRDEAIEWLESNGGTEALIEHFSDALEEA